MLLETDKKIKSKTRTDKILKILLLIITIICASSIIFISLFIFIKGISPFIKEYNVNGELVKISFLDFLFGNTWFKSPSTYGIGYIILNTIYVTLISLIIAIPISILSALFISRIAPKILKNILNTIVELLASIPSVIYGMFGAGVITNAVNNLANLFNYQSAGGLSNLATSLVLAIMIIPTITMISVTAINSVPNSYVLGSLALGASKTETNFKVVLKGARPGIFSGIILGVGRALGEATAISMVCGNAGSGPSFNPFDITRTLTSTMLFNIHETSGMDYDIRFSLGLVLIIIILLSNIILNLVKKRIVKNNG